MVLGVATWLQYHLCHRPANTSCTDLPTPLVPTSHVLLNHNLTCVYYRHLPITKYTLFNWIKRFKAQHMFDSSSNWTGLDWTYSRYHFSKARYSRCHYCRAPYSRCHYSTAPYSRCHYSRAPYSRYQYSTLFQVSHQYSTLFQVYSSPLSSSLRVTCPSGWNSIDLPQNFDLILNTWSVHYAVGR